ncbi:MAG TPA: TonB-dependent receptor [Bryobacteraceae bacterium]|nr:TonB-dependent receptor [Bryobacteraceae bacterium]
MGIDGRTLRSARAICLSPSGSGFEELVSAAQAINDAGNRAFPPAAPDSKSSFQRTAVTAAADTPAHSSESGAAAEQDPAAAAELARRAADGFLINGSVNNAASSPFAQLPAFGNNRRGRRSLYNGNFGLIANNSRFDARSFSLTGQQTPKPAYSRVQALVSFGGPIRIPGLIRRNGPTFTVNYQWTRSSNASTQTGLMPTPAERAGDFSHSGRRVFDPDTGAPFPDNRIPHTRISPQARDLLTLFPLPNFSAGGRYNYQVPVLTGLHQDDLQTRINKRFRRNFVSGSVAAQSTRSDTPDLFGFVDTGRISGINVGLNYGRGFSPRTFVNVRYELSRLSTRVTPYFAGRRNISGDAGIAGNNQEPVNWGSPALLFSSGITSLTEAQASLTRNQTSGLSIDWFLSRGRHNVTFGFNHRRQQFNVLSQQDARGTFVFTGAAAGHDLAGFLLGVPDTASIAFGNADKYLRASVNEAFINNDWRVNPGLTVNAGLRWEYWSPVREKYGRLVNLDIAPGFAAARPVVARNTSADAFPRPDRNNFAPRVAFSWRPLPASSMVVRGGYGVYFDTSVYHPIAMLMAQQAPLSRSLRVANNPETRLTLANGFNAAVSATEATTFGVDPAFRAGYSQNWQLSIQRDLPAALQMTAGYSGGKGTRAQQQFLPNTFPDGAVFPSGFTYLTSNGNSIRHAGQVQLGRRLRSGLTGSLQYTLAKSIDDAALGGRNEGARLIAQNWLDLRAERALSNFDQRHLLAATVQYTTGMGLRGGALAAGRVAALLREWTFGSQITAGSGLPLTPVYLSAVRGTGVTGSIRPDYTGASLHDAPPGFFLNPAAYAVPARGRWGNAGRNSITGPSQFVLNASLGRTLRSSERVSLDLRIDASNALNYVTWSRWNTTIGNDQFGLPVAANPMRTVQATIRMRF